MQTIELHITGMNCGACQQHVAQTLMAAPGVQSAAVDLQSGLAQVQGTDLNAAALLEAVEEEGYAAQISRAANPG